MRSKVLLVYKENHDLKIESLWATKTGDHYRIDNIPFFAKNIAPGDIVSVENDDGELYFKELIQASGNSVVRIVVFNEKDVSLITSELEGLGCNWEGSHLSKLISIEVPKRVNYDEIKNYLLHGRKTKLFDFEEACLGFR